MSPSASSPSMELIGMVRTLADARASMPPKQRGTIRKEYGVNVDVTDFLGTLNYTAGGGKLMPDLRFMVEEDRILLRGYKPGDWEAALKRAYDDLLAQSGAFAGISVRIPRPISDASGGAIPRRHARPRKKGVLDRILGTFTESED